jgi:hypothetical protein
MTLPKRKSPRLQGFDYSNANMYYVTICAQHKQCLFGEVVNEKMQLNWKGEIVNECWMKLPNHYPHITLDTFVTMPNHFHGLLSINNICRGEVASPDIVQNHKAGNEFKSSQIDTTDLNPITNRRGEVASPDIMQNHKAGNKFKSNQINTADLNPIPNRRGEITSPDIAHNHTTDRETLSLPRPALGQIIAYFKYLTTKIINQKTNTPGTKLWQRSFFDHIIRNDEDYWNTQSYIDANPAKWD